MAKIDKFYSDDWGTEEVPVKHRDISYARTELYRRLLNVHPNGNANDIVRALDRLISAHVKRLR